MTEGLRPLGRVTGATGPQAQTKTINMKRDASYQRTSGSSIAVSRMLASTTAVAAQTDSYR